VLEHPSGATDVILRVEWGGGFVPPNTTVTQAPQFTLYGDGTAVFESLPDVNGTTFNEPKPALLTGHMPEPRVQELLNYALHEGGLANAKTSYDFPGVADAGTTTFTINAGGVDKMVSVYALMEGTNQGPDQADREALNTLQQRLTNFETEARSGGTESVADYDPDAYKVVMFDDLGGTPPAGVEPIQWPWQDVRPTDFVQTGTNPGAMLSMSREQVAKLTSVPNGGQLSIWVETPDGTDVTFALRPWLPDEAAVQPTSS
jgi:hypothetical protein